MGMPYTSVLYWNAPMLSIMTMIIMVLTVTIRYTNDNCVATIFIAQITLLVTIMMLIMTIFMPMVLMKWTARIFISGCTTFVITSAYGYGFIRLFDRFSVAVLRMGVRSSLDPTNVDHSMTFQCFSCLTRPVTIDWCDLYDNQEMLDSASNIKPVNRYGKYILRLNP